MSNLSQFLGEPAVTSIVNAASSGGTSVNAVTTTQMNNYGAKAVTSGVLTQNILATVISVTGSGGELKLFGVASVDATSRTHRIKITIDGVVVFDATSAAVTVSNIGIVAVGGLQVVSGATTGFTFDALHFSTSLLVEYASSVTETDKTNLYYVYATT